LSKVAYIALGSNLGDPIAHIQFAFKELETLSQTPVRQSSIWRSTPVDCPPGSPDFINAAAAIKPLTEETPETLLGKLQALEINAGRQPKVVMNEPRPLDLDIIAFGAEQRSSAELTIPHPRFHERSFVLKPLAEIAPGVVFPGHIQSIAEMLDALAPNDTLIRL
tara:strand:+ start:18688 stop:19182 length:495 start_codon:yes stop_codon:yes gene_type:complete